MADYTFSPEHDGTVPIKTAVFQALGAASVCWESMDGTGVFDSRRAEQIGDALLEVIEKETARPNLGLATTRQILDELRARIEVDYFVGGGGLDYTSVAGRPEGGVTA